MVSAIHKLSDEEAMSLLYDWKFWARPEQQIPKGDWLVWMLLSGRGAGKTRTGAEYIIERVRQGFKYIALVGKTKADVRDTMIEFGDSSILKVSPPWNRPEYEPSKRRLTWNNGAVAIAYSGDDPDQLRGPQHDTAWVDELAKFQYPQETWDNLRFGLRIGINPRIIVTTTPRPIPLIKQLAKDTSTYVTRTSSYKNKDNLSDVFVKQVLSKYAGTRLGRQEIEGEILEDAVGALWKQGTIDKNRVSTYPVLHRIVTAIDPSVTSTEEAAEAGIVTAGIADNGQIYVLRDGSMIASPNTWARKAIHDYNEYEGDRIVAEVNNGGDMIESLIRTINDKIPYTAVRATRGKLTRAEPVSALYEQDKVHHVGVFPELEDQMCNWIPGEKSPDRMDALVWAITELALTEQPNDIGEQIADLDGVLV